MNLQKLYKCSYGDIAGRSKIVGTPMSQLLKWKDCTVTVCHSKTRNLESVVSNAEILVVGVGKAKFVPGHWIKPGAVVIDCGINSIPDSTKKSGMDEENINCHVTTLYLYFKMCLLMLWIFIQLKHYMF